MKIFLSKVEGSAQKLDDILENSDFRRETIWETHHLAEIVCFVSVDQMKIDESLKLFLGL